MRADIILFTFIPQPQHRISGHAQQAAFQPRPVPMSDDTAPKVHSITDADLKNKTTIKAGFHYSQPRPEDGPRRPPPPRTILFKNAVIQYSTDGKEYYGIPETQGMIKMKDVHSLYLSEDGADGEKPPVLMFTR